MNSTILQYVKVSVQSIISIFQQGMLYILLHYCIFYSRVY